MLRKDIEMIVRKNQRYLDMLEEYDRTGHLPTEKIRRSFTLKRMTVKRLKELSRERNRSMSDLIDEMVNSGKRRGTG